MHLVFSKVTESFWPPVCFVKGRLLLPTATTSSASHRHSVQKIRKMNKHRGENAMWKWLVHNNDFQY